MNCDLLLILRKKLGKSSNNPKGQISVALGPCWRIGHSVAFSYAPYDFELITWG
jgi:hypothetical protein